MDTVKDPSPKLLHWLLLLALGMTWGSSFILMKKGLLVFSHLQVASLRMFISFLLLSPMIVYYTRSLKKRHWILLFFVGMLGNGIPAFLFTKAQTRLDSSVVGVLNSMVPLFTMLIGAAFFRSKLVWRQFAGIFLGLSGTVLLLSANYRSGGDTIYTLFVIGASLCYAINLNIVRNYLTDVNALAISSVAFIFSGIPSGIYLYFSDFGERLNTQPDAWFSLGCVFLLAMFGTALAVITFNYLIKSVSPLFAASVTYIVPLFAIMWGFSDGELIRMGQIAGAGVILAGIYIVNKT